jgi:hypothetical protein
MYFDANSDGFLYITTNVHTLNFIARTSHVKYQVGKSPPSHTIQTMGAFSKWPTFVSVVEVHRMSYQNVFPRGRNTVHTTRQSMRNS